MSESFTLRLAKQDFKFSVAHFTIFGADRAEPLHGHNYRLALELEGRVAGEYGLLADCDAWKRAARAVCATLDDKVLVATASPHVECREEGGDLVVRFAERSYRFPERETLRLPLVNISMELLARWAWERLAPAAAGTAVERLTVEIEETPGQLCRFAAPVAG
jgi:6-pyruvoyltetrahydropterin/6-carboxytetrahydropterin synthase